MTLPYVDTAGVWDWSLYQGDTRMWTFSIIDGESPVDVSGATITMTVKKKRGATVEAVWTGSTTTGEITVNGLDNNVVNVHIPSTTSDPNTGTSSWPSGSLVYDVEFVESGRIVTYLTGTITVTREVSQ